MPEAKFVQPTIWNLAGRGIRASYHRSGYHHSPSVADTGLSAWPTTRAAGTLDAGGCWKPRGNVQ